MFSVLKFKMANSLGIPVEVSITYSNGFLSYEIEFLANGEHGDKKKIKKHVMSKGNSNKFIRKWEKVSCNDIFLQLREIAHLHEGKDWQLKIVYEDTEVSLSGDKLGSNSLMPFIQPLIELFDSTFGITQFVKPTRIDRLEIEMFEPFEVPSELSFLGDRKQFGHKEFVSIDRESLTLSYSRRVPNGCFHNSYECHCESEVRDILDQTSDIFEDLSLFRDCISENGPLLTFTFYFHNGSQTEVHKTLSKSGVGNFVYDEMLQVIGQTISCTVFSGSVFDFNS